MKPVSQRLNTMILRAILTVIVLCCATPSTRAQFNRLDPSSAANVDALVEAGMRGKGIVGCSVGLMRAGEIAWLKGYGLRDRENGILATEHTIYRTGSIAKTFTAILAMQLWEQGRLDLQADARAYVPEYPEKPQGTITPYRLLCHRSGIRHYEEYDTASAVHYERDHLFYDPIAALDVFKNGTLLFTPGTAFSYSTFGYNLLGAVIERAGEQPFEEQLRERINTVLDLPYVQAEYQRLRPYPEETKGYHSEGGVVIETPEDIGILFKVPGGGLLCTAVDLTLLMQGLARYRLLADSATQNWMSIDHSGGSGFGLGIMTRTHNGRPYLLHLGGQQRTSTVWLYDPETLDGVVITSNTFVGLESFALNLLDVIRDSQLQGSPYAHIPHTLEAPRLLSPSGGAVVDGRDITLRWTPVPHAFTYICEHATDSTFTDARRDTVHSTTIALSDLTSGQDIYWRVQARNDFLYGGTVGPFSAKSAFLTASVSGMTAIPPHADIVVYPNPAKGTVSISAAGDRRIIAVTVHSLSGKLLSRWSIDSEQNISIPLGEIGYGIVLLSIRTNDGRDTSHLLLRPR
ncbi:MAG: serine hydrolase [Bacteroidetes bacterium]|nr:serine hydrolase [Bacteroidota bacterium]